MNTTLLILSIAAELTQSPVTTVWVRAQYNGQANTWTVRLCPQSGFAGPIWFGGDTVTVTGRKDYYWLVSTYNEPVGIFHAELVKEGE